MADEKVIIQGEADKVLYIILLGAVKVYMKEEETKSYIEIMKTKVFESYQRKYYMKIAMNKK